MYEKSFPLSMVKLYLKKLFEKYLIEYNDEDEVIPVAQPEFFLESILA